MYRRFPETGGILFTRGRYVGSKTNSLGSLRTACIKWKVGLSSTLMRGCTRSASLERLRARNQASADEYTYLTLKGFPLAAFGQLRSSPERFKRIINLGRLSLLYRSSLGLMHGGVSVQPNKPQCYCNESPPSPHLSCFIASPSSSCTKCTF